MELATVNTNYNIPSNNRELQLEARFKTYSYIITYQVITGNYNRLSNILTSVFIITYQVITGNYNEYVEGEDDEQIITYQVITGNYNVLLLRS